MTAAAMRAGPRCGGLISLLALVALTAVAVAETLTFPRLTGRVVDEAAILDASTRAALTEKLAALEAKTTDQLVVATVKSLQGTSVEDYGNRLFREWKLGQATKNNGVLLLVAPNERKVRIEVGYGLEGTLPDAVTKLIIENGIAPRFRANDYAGGIARGVDDVIQILTGDAEEWKRRAAQRPDDTSGLVFALLFNLVVIMILIVLFSITRYSQPPLASGRTMRRGVPPFWWGVPGSSPSWGPSDSGGFSGGGFSDGGFSGGGGSSGGGGASGSW